MDELPELGFKDKNFYRTITMKLTYPNGTKTTCRSPAQYPEEDAKQIEWSWGYARHHRCKIRRAYVEYMRWNGDWDEVEILPLVVPDDLIAEDDR